MRSRERRAAVLSTALWAAATLLAVPVLVHGGQADPQDFTQLEKGRYLAVVADCASCHTVPGSGHPYAGGRAIETPFGNLVASNITPDRETGIGAWTDDQFDAALRQGRRPDGSRLYPAMPYNAYTKMSRADVLALRAYLNTVPPVRNPVQANALPFPYNVRALMGVWDGLYFTEGEFRPDAQKSAEWNRGAYLVTGPAHCAACHTPKSFLGGDKDSRYLQGSPLQGWFAPNITDGNAEGLGGWTHEDLVTFLRTGHNRLSAATGPMAEVVALSTSQMTEADVNAIATYLKSLAGGNEPAAPLSAGDPRMIAGQAIYRDQCSACHGLDGHGTPFLFPSLADSPVVGADDPASLVRVVLRGARSVATAAEPTSPGMPSYGGLLNDAQVAAVLTYVRNGWGKGASPVSSDAVAHARSQLAARAD
jgi:mono/diheme cytochrome c family protein